LSKLAADAAEQETVAPPEVAEGSTAGATIQTVTETQEPQVIEGTVGGEPALPDKLPFAVKQEAEQPEAGDAATTDASWNIQIGSFKNKKEAQKEIKSLKAKVPDIFGDKKAFAVTVQKGNETTYRCRFEGFTEKTAKAACRKLEKRKTSCYVLAPSS
jgi:cell division septation protein DedD